VIGLLLPAIALLSLSAFLSAAESSVFAISHSRLRTLVEEGFRGAEPLRAARSSGTGVRAAALVLNSALNLTAAGILLTLILLRWGAQGIWYGIPGVTFLVITVAELLPRAVASRQSLRLALLAAPLLLAVERPLRPFLTRILDPDEAGPKKGGGEDSVIDRELRELTEIGRREGVLEEDEHALVERAFRMDELTAWDIMTPRVDVFAWNAELTVADVVPQLRSVPYSRIPIYAHSIDEIVRILSVREIYEAFVSGRGEAPLGSLGREPFFLPGSLPLPRLLRDFQTRRIHMGVVADEFGGTDGLVTLEDVIEELVGDIQDETDPPEDPILRTSEDLIEVDASTDLREINEAFGSELPYLDHRSLNGYILEEMGRVPAVGETMLVPGAEIEILEATETTVRRARLRRLSVGDEAPQEK